jgi:hypothetical protein
LIWVIQKARAIRLRAFSVFGRLSDFMIAQTKNAALHRRAAFL